MKNILLPTVMILIFSFAADAQVFGKKKSADKSRAEIMAIHDDVLEQLYKEAPHTKKELKKAYGYAVFKNIGVNVVILSGGGGRGVAVNNKTGKKTYMRMGSAGVSIGLGVKDFRGVFIFHTKTAFRQFVDKGWDFSGQADAAAKTGSKGGELSEAVKIGNGVSVYQMTKKGLALQITLQGTKYWKSKKLNN